MTQPITANLVMLEVRRKEASSKSRFFLPISAIIPGRRAYHAMQMGFTGRLRIIRALSTANWPSTITPSFEVRDKPEPFDPNQEATE